MLTFGEQLKSARQALELSVKDSARRMDVEPAQVRMWESGDRTPAPERQAVLLAALSVPVAEPDRAEYQRGALWALAAMHETLGRLYRELAQQAPAATAPPVSPSEAAEYEAMLSLADPANAPAAAAPSRARKRR
jgi:transcriptional regulator with XRE-family HTH domain